MSNRKPSYVMLHRVVVSEQEVSHYEDEELEINDVLKWDVWLRAELPGGGPDEILGYGRMYDDYETAKTYADKLADRFNVEVDEY